MTTSDKKKAPSPFSLRLSIEERQRLEQQAVGSSLGEYIRSCIFADDAPVNKTRGRFPVQDEQALSQLLGMLGQSRIPQNINQLAKAANSGSLPVTPDTKKQLYEACRAIAWMRHQLVTALGIKSE